jgi:signal transduction histidine kinase/CheY-like chemotaxis protein
VTSRLRGKEAPLNEGPVEVAPDATLKEIRARLLRGYLKAVAAILGPGFLLMTLLVFPNIKVTYAFSYTFVAAFVVLAWGKLSEKTRAWGFVLVSSGYMTSILFVQGFGIGPLAAGCTVPVTTYLLVGARAGLLATGLWILSIAALGLASTLGGYLPPGSDEVIAASLRHWPQVVIISGLTIGPVLIVARGVVSNLERVLESKIRLVQQLREAQETLAQSERFRTLGVLAGGIAHDINNTLTVIMGETEILDIPQESRRAILEASEGAAQMTRQLLQSAGTSLVQPQALHLPADLESTLRSLRRVLPSNIEFVEHSLADDQVVIADRVMLQQAILNLAFNARDAMPGGGTLSLRIEAKPIEGRNWLELILADTGTGMEASVLARATEPLFTTKPVGKGTGLGLSNVKSTIEAFGGTFELSSAPGHGTQARILLPLTENNIHKLVPTSGVEKSRLHLLLVDDNAHLRALMTQALVRQGHAVEACETFAAASSAIDRQSFDGMISDVVLPDGSGVQLARRYRRRCPDGRVLLVSGYSPSALDRTAILENEFRLLRKPFRMSDLVLSLSDAEDLKSVGS